MMALHFSTASRMICRRRALEGSWTVRDKLPTMVRTAPRGVFSSWATPAARRPTPARWLSSAISTCRA